MLKINTNINKYKDPEEFYNLFIYLKEHNHNLLEMRFMEARKFFKYMTTKQYMDNDYYNHIEEEFGTFFTGKNNSSSYMDATLIIDYIYKRECIIGTTKQDIEKFFLYHYAKIMSDEMNDNYGTLKQQFKNLIKLDEEIEIDINPIPYNIKNYKLTYYNFEEIKNKLDDIKTLINEDQKSLAIDLLEELKKQL